MSAMLEVAPLALATAVVALLQWSAFAAIALRSREPIPKSGTRSSDRNLLISSAVGLALWCGAFGSELFRPEAKAEVAAASIAGRVEGTGTCASVEIGMTAEQVRTLLGDPSGVSDVAAIRGPGAELWRYDDSRCSLYVVDGKVEYIE
ncbi:MAG TPA: hypothetical protein VMT00_08095 [Thermoanaerobaculia bacterium]|nr:hypothetical protein [Thermoanaerobaculia bacterium]